MWERIPVHRSENCETKKKGSQLKSISLSWLLSWATEAHCCGEPLEELCKTHFRMVPLLDRSLSFIKRQTGAKIPVFPLSLCDPGGNHDFWKVLEQKNEEAWQVLGWAVCALGRTRLCEGFQLPLSWVTENFLSRVNDKGNSCGGCFYQSSKFSLVPTCKYALSH